MVETKFNILILATDNTFQAYHQNCITCLLSSLPYPAWLEDQIATLSKKTLTRMAVDLFPHLRHGLTSRKHSHQRTNRLIFITFFSFCSYATYFSGLQIFDCKPFVRKTPLLNTEKNCLIISLASGTLFQIEVRIKEGNSMRTTSRDFSDLSVASLSCPD